MEKRLREILLEGEQVRWSGRPTPFRLLTQPVRRSLILTWCVSAVALLGILWVVLPMSAGKAGGMLDALLLAAAAFLPLTIALRPLLDKLSLEHSTLYAITNYRVISLVGDELMFIPLGSKLRAAIEGQDGGCGNLCFGDAIGQDQRKSLTHAVTGVRDEDAADARVPGLIFYHVDQPENLLSYLA